MAAKNEAYEQKIIYEIIVDCYDACEQNMGWFTYAQDEMTFPFTAEVAFLKRTGKTEVKKVDVVDLSEASAAAWDAADLKVMVDLNGYLIEVALHELRSIKASAAMSAPKNDATTMSRR